MPSYCEYINSLTGELRELHQAYHDNDYGFTLYDDNALFGRFLLEINQAGLSWTLMLRKLNGFERAYDGFDIDKIASYGEDDFNRLMNDSGIIRNRLKIRAAIENAKRIQALQRKYGSFRKWLDVNAETNKTLADWTSLFKKRFVFTGGEIVNEFLMSIGMLPGAHSPECEVYNRRRSGVVA
ncbi:MAG: DNA-3-methyladenine glycosylase I [Bacteroidetes bacterium]|nr:DNA-3-methyladenine glycosylase I [Bacteroidota bacterium]